MTLHHGWLYVRDREGDMEELINHARTAAYLRNATLLPSDVVTIADVPEYGGCRAYAYSPVCGAEAITDASGAVITDALGDPITTADLGDGGINWSLMSFDTPTTDNAPWYHADYPDSADALGMFITEWTGLDDVDVVTRPVLGSGRPGGGGRHGVLRNGPRVMKLNLLLFARSEGGMNHLFDWLRATLYGICATCETSSIVIRRTCPEEGGLESGLVELREVALTEGLSWESYLDDNAAGCYVRLASFAITAADPCMYFEESTVAFDVLDAADVPACYAALPLSADGTDCRPRCHDLVHPDCRSWFTFSTDHMGAVAPVLTLTNDDTGWVPPTRVICYYDPQDIDVDASGPCGMPIMGELYIRSLPPSSELRWDVIGRRVEFRDHSTGDYVSGYAYIDGNDPPVPRFFSLPCGTSHIVIEPATLCMEIDGAGNRYLLDGIEFDDTAIHFPSMTLSLVERTGCA